MNEQDKKHNAFSTLDRAGTGDVKEGDRAEQNRMQYECTGRCRLCPFPGLKCIKDSHDLAAKTWKF